MIIHSVCTHKQGSYKQGLKDMIVRMNSQNQASFASISATIQNLNIEVLGIKEQLRKPQIKKRKVLQNLSGPYCIYIRLLFFCSQRNNLITFKFVSLVVCYVYVVVL